MKTSRGKTATRKVSPSSKKRFMVGMGTVAFGKQNPFKKQQEDKKAAVAN